MVSLYINRVLVTVIKRKYNLTSLMFRRDHKVITTANGVFAIGGSIVTAKVSKTLNPKYPIQLKHIRYYTILKTKNLYSYYKF